MQRVFNLLGSPVNHNMNRNEVAELLEKNGFKTLNMKEYERIYIFYFAKCQYAAIIRSEGGNERLPVYVLNIIQSIKKDK